MLAIYEDASTRHLGLLIAAKINVNSCYYGQTALAMSVCVASKCHVAGCVYGQYGQTPLSGISRDAHDLSHAYQCVPNYGPLSFVPQYPSQCNDPQYPSQCNDPKYPSQCNDPQYPSQCNDFTARRGQGKVRVSLHSASHSASHSALHVPSYLVSRVPLRRIKMLLDAGASVNARVTRRDEYLYRSETALDIAVRTGNIGAVELLLQYGANRLCCAHSVETVPENVRRACLQAGIDLNGSDLNGSDLNGIELNGIDRNEGREVGIFF
jgi:hypothetical protein